MLRGSQLAAVVGLLVIQPAAVGIAGEPEVSPFPVSLGERLFVHNSAHPDEWTGPEAAREWRGWTWSTIQRSLMCCLS